VFEFTDRNPQRSSGPEPAALEAARLAWQLMVGRDRRPIGVRLSVSRNPRGPAVPALSALLDGVLQGLVLRPNDEEQFPEGLVLMSPAGIDPDAAMSSWSAPRNVLLEIGQAELDAEQRLRQLFELQGHGVRLALRLDQPAAPAAERLSGFAYLLSALQPPPVDPKACPVLALNIDSQARAEAAFSSGAHAAVGWPLKIGRHAAPRGLSPAQNAVFELIRLVQADADLRDLERVFKGEPLLGYLLLTLANSAALRRQTPVASIGHAISLLGYQRLIKWLVLLLAMSTKDKDVAPLVFISVTRGYLLENLLAAASRPRAEQDDAFVIGAFSLLDSITGQPLDDLLRDVNLPAPVSDALIGAGGPYAGLLDVARSFETGGETALLAAQAGLQITPGLANRALLQSLAQADALRSLI
jgi:EAL and modified HD-GYP domain-containing signal transduction protein